MHLLAVLLAGLSVASGARLEGDYRLRATVSPNGDGVRDAAIVRFRLARPATVTLEAVRTDTNPGRQSGRRDDLVAALAAVRGTACGPLAAGAHDAAAHVSAPRFGAFR